MQPQKQSSSKSSIIIIIVLIVGAAAAYFYYSGVPKDTSSTLESSNTTESADAQAAGARILSLTNQIGKLKINPKIFTSAVYKTLTDKTVEIPELPVGRPNPFAPLPGTAPIVAPKH